MLPNMGVALEGMVTAVLRDILAVLQAKHGPRSGSSGPLSGALGPREAPSLKLAGAGPAASSLSSLPSLLLP